jgi:hypothetical protein
MYVAAQRAELMLRIGKTKQTAYSEDELKELSTESLEKVAKLVAASTPLVDHSGHGTPRPDSAQEDEAPVVIDMNARILEMRKRA